MLQDGQGNRKLGTRRMHISKENSTYQSLLRHCVLGITLSDRTLRTSHPLQAVKFNLLVAEGLERRVYRGAHQWRETAPGAANVDEEAAADLNHQWWLISSR